MIIRILAEPEPYYEDEDDDEFGAELVDDEDAVPNAPDNLMGVGIDADMDMPNMHDIIFEGQGGLTAE